MKLGRPLGRRYKHSLECLCCSHQDFKNFHRGETPGPLLTGAGREKEGREGVKGFLPIKGEDRRGEEDEESKGGEGPAAGGSCTKVLGGIDAPVKSSG